jgi:hypothetical protein
MKNIYRLLAAAFLAFAMSHPLSAGTDDKKKDVDIDKSDILIEIGGEDIIRSMPVLEVFIDESLSVLEVNHSGIGYTEMMIVDMQGNVLDYACADSSVSSMTQMDLPVIPGTYRIVILSHRYYAEGVFIVE